MDTKQTKIVQSGVTSLVSQPKPTDQEDFVLYTLLGDPIPLARARIGQSADRFWDSQKQIKLASSLNIKNQHVFADGSLRPFYKGPLHLNVTFFMKMFKTGKQRPGQYHVFKPDTDNMIKFICDICNNLLFHDDSQISSISARKVYSRKERTEFSIIELDR
jgi:Holliday junction resolvase RusA-like endonuclease